MKKVLALLLVLCMVFSLAACSSDENKDAPTPTAGGTEVTTPTENNGTKTTPEPTPTDEPVVVIEDKDEIKELTGGQLVDGKFPEKKHITVEVYDRDGGTPANDNMPRFPCSRRDSIS